MVPWDVIPRVHALQDAYFGKGVKAARYVYHCTIGAGSSEYAVEYLNVPTGAAHGGPGLKRPLLRRLAHIKVPTLVVFAENDETLGPPRSGYNAVAAALEQARGLKSKPFPEPLEPAVVILRGAGHGLVYTHPGPLAQMLCGHGFPSSRFVLVPPEVAASENSFKKTQ